MGNRITVVTVVGEGVENTFNSSKLPDQTWENCRIDDIETDVKVTIRRWATSGHPLTVYLDGAIPIYPTIVYRSGGALLAFSPGKIGLQS